MNWLTWHETRPRRSRGWVALVLGEIGDANTTALLMALAKDASLDRGTRSNAIGSLGHMRAVDAQPLMESLLSDENLKANAAIALSQITGKRHPLVPEGYGGPDWPNIKEEDPIATFRAQAIHESADDYAAAWVAFYLRRIEEHKGEYFPNVAKLLSVQNGVPALIEILDSKDGKLAKRAEAILGEIHHSLGTKEKPPALPKSKPEWLEWWKRDGVKLSPKMLWSNFDSHYQ